MTGFFSNFCIVLDDMISCWFLYRGPDQGSIVASSQKILVPFLCFFLTQFPTLRVRSLGWLSSIERDLRVVGLTWLMFYLFDWFALFDRGRDILKSNVKKEEAVLSGWWEDGWLGRWDRPAGEFLLNGDLTELVSLACATKLKDLSIRKLLHLDLSSTNWGKSEIQDP